MSEQPDVRKRPGDSRGAGRGLRSLLRPAVIAIVAGVLVVAVGIGLWARQMVTPVTVTGTPTATIQPLPAPTSANPSATPTEAGTPSGTPTGTAPTSASPSASPSKTPTMKSSGKFDVAGVQVQPVSSSGELRTYTVRVETSSGLKADRTATKLAAVLNDPRSWTGSGSIRFGLVKDATKADFSLTLASPATAAKSCRTVSGTCLDGSDVVIDALAFTHAPATYPDALADWQAYLVNHGLGALLGEKTATCPRKAKPAPVMMPQADDLGGCTANPWPYP